jgi:hypothetical protein
LRSVNDQARRAQLLVSTPPYKAVIRRPET